MIKPSHLMAMCLVLIACPVVGGAQGKAKKNDPVSKKISIRIEAVQAIAGMSADENKSVKEFAKGITVFVKDHATRGGFGDLDPSAGASSKSPYVIKTTVGKVASSLEIAPYFAEVSVYKGGTTLIGHWVGRAASLRNYTMALGQGAARFPFGLLGELSARATRRIAADAGLSANTANPFKGLPALDKIGISFGVSDSGEILTQGPLNGKSYVVKAHPEQGIDVSFKAASERPEMYAIFEEDPQGGIQSIAAPSEPVSLSMFTSPIKILLDKKPTSKKTRVWILTYSLNQNKGKRLPDVQAGKKEEAQPDIFVFDDMSKTDSKIELKADAQVRAFFEKLSKKEISDVRATYVDLDLKYAG